jgi:hypothetical protein
MHSTRATVLEPILQACTLAIAADFGIAEVDMANGYRCSCGQIAAPDNASRRSARAISDVMRAAEWLQTHWPEEFAESDLHLTSFAAPDQLIIDRRGSILDADEGSMFRAD